MRRILYIAVAACVCLLAGFVPATPVAAWTPSVRPAPVVGPGQAVDEPLPAGIPEDMTYAAKIGAHSLFVRHEGDFTGEFAVRDNDGGLIWFSNPQDKEAESAKGPARFETFSQLIILGYDGETGSERTVNSYIGTKKTEAITVTLVEGGFKAEYWFENDRLAVVLYVQLIDGAVQVRCPPEEMREDGTYKVVAVSVAPYFGCGGPEEAGYLMVPDGSGALIDFNNGKTEARSFSMPVYGEDPTFFKDTRGAYTQTASLPVYGIRRGETGFLAVIEQGASAAKIEALVSGKRNSRNTVFATFTLRSVDLVVIGEGASYQTKEVVKYDLEHWNAADCAVRFYPLAEGRSTYAHMAIRYRELLLARRETAAVSVETPPLFTEWYGGVYRQETTLGLTFTRYKTLTGYNRLMEIRDELEADGNTEVIALLRQWSQDEAKYKLPNKLRPSGDLGGSKAFKALAGDTYLHVSPLTIRRGGNGFTAFFDAVKRMSREPVRLYTYQRSTQYKDLSVTPGYLPSIPILEKALSSYRQSMEKQGASLAYVTDLGTMLFSDFDSKRYATREDVEAAAVSFFEQVCGMTDGGLMAERPNAYVLPYTSGAAGLPSGSSDFDVEDRAIPFYQLALSGVMPYSLEAVNLSSNPRRAVLNCLETAAGLQFSLIGAEGQALKETSLNHLYGADYSRWKTFILEAQAEVNRVYGEIGATVILDHERLQADVTRTVFQNGNSLVINYSDKSVDTEYGVIESMGYRVVQTPG